MGKNRFLILVTEATCALRIGLFSILVLGGLYAAVLRGFARAAVPASAEGSLVRNADGTIIGSRLIAQKFSQPFYFWPRPSAVDYNAAAAGGSNLSSSSPELKRLVSGRIAALGGTAAKPVPVELLAASGSGLDPHLSVEAVLYQSERVAAARGFNPASFRDWLGSWTDEGINRRKAPLINVLELNIALDERFGSPPNPAGNRSLEVLK